jgi:hypothetical protein
VFECDLSAQEKIELEQKLTTEINSKEDQVLFIRLGRPAEQRGNREITGLGVPYLSVDIRDPLLSRCREHERFLCKLSATKSSKILIPRRKQAVDGLHQPFE